MLTELTRKGRESGDATKNVQSMKAVVLQETRHRDSVSITTNVKTNPNFVSPASEKSMKIYKELTSYDRNSFLIKIFFQLNLSKIVIVCRGLNQGTPVFKENL